LFVLQNKSYLYLGDNSETCSPDCSSESVCACGKCKCISSGSCSVCNVTAGNALICNGRGIVDSSCTTCTCSYPFTGPNCLQCLNPCGNGVADPNKYVSSFLFLISFLVTAIVDALEIGFLIQLISIQPI
jgi:hypothetical protein